MPKFTVNSFKRWVAAARKTNKTRDKAMERQLKWLQKLKAEDHPAESLIERTMSEVLCHGDISYCCASPKSKTTEGKYCPNRDALLDALGITLTDYEKSKIKMTDVFYDLLKKKGVTK